MAHGAEFIRLILEQIRVLATVGIVADKTDMLGGGSIDAISVRRQRVREFLKDSSWNEEAYKVWLRKDPASPTKVAMAKSLAHAALSLARQGVEMVSDEEEIRRTELCNGCEFAMQDKTRCSMCGCFIKWKIRMKAWHCPVKKW